MAPSAGELRGPRRLGRRENPGISRYWPSPWYHVIPENQVSKLVGHAVVTVTERYVRSLALLAEVPGI